MIRCLTLLLTLVATALNAGWALAQSASNNRACVQAFAPLREEAESRGRLIKAASERHAPPQEACRLIGEFAQSEVRMIKYLEANSAECGVPQRTADQLKAGHQRTEALRMKLCATGLQKRGPVGDFHGISNISLRTEPARPRGPVGDFDKVR
ncbi:hypothetical protein [Afipia sp. GAS231]|uniref:hypothetical protein n=1 Tax=Afipia sp. GAS231 TaxID=1882747 RepID=UPI00087940DE|nr:hypothetical protein [Afipia sp. GAS231]SDO80091.1 hypothetical protein SAMN05444050_5044 [Afipia sp. GAS231]